MGLLDLLFGSGTTADDVNSILASTAANGTALSNTATANTHTLIANVVDGMTNLVDTTLQTTLAGVTALEESTLAGSAKAMNSVAGSAIEFTESTYSMAYSGPPDSPTSTKTVITTLTHNGGATIMSAYASHTLGGLTTGVGNGIAGLMDGIGQGSGNAMANLGAHLPDVLPALAGSLGGGLATSLGSAGLLANSQI